MAKQKNGEVTLQELITLRNSAQLALDVVDGMIAELAAGESAQYCPSPCITHPIHLAPDLEEHLQG